MYFNSRPHEEVDKFLIANAEKKKGFQLTTSRRGRRGIAPMWKAHDSVSTHDLTKRSTHHLSNTDHIDRVSTHDLSKRSTVGTIGRKTAVAFQLTTSRRGRRRSKEHQTRFANVSTHDLTKRSTGPALTPCQWQKSFNSRPHEEVDSSPAPPNPSPTVFQLTTSRRGRQG